MKKFRSFAEVLAEWQGGVKLKPGHSYVRDVTEAQAKELFGGAIPAALAIGDKILTTRQIEPGIYRIIVRRAT